MTTNTTYSYRGPSQATASDWSNSADWSASSANAPDFPGAVGADDTVVVADATFDFAGAALTNDGTLQGDGLGLDDATLAQAGTIEAAGPGGLVLANDAIEQTGAGLIEAVGGAGSATALTIVGSTISGGTVEADDQPGSFAPTVTIAASKLNSVDLFADGSGAVVSISASTSLNGASATLANGGTIAISSSFSGAATFLGGGDALVLAQPDLSAAHPDTLGPIRGFVEGDAIDLTTLDFASVTTPLSFSVQADGDTVVTIQGETLGGAAVSEHLTFVGKAYAGAVSLAQGAGGGAVVETSVVCFCAGTRIRTPRGEVEIEKLAVGDMAATASGAPRQIRWIGRGVVDVGQYPHAMPVRIATHALGPDRPARDLRVSPAHALCLDLLGEVLVPAGALVNGATITRDPVERVEYWHVELDRHDILVAENLPVESYLDMGNRAFFSGDGAPGDPDGDPSARSHGDFCRPFHERGVLVEAARAQLRARAEAQGWRLVEEAPWTGVYLEVDGRIVRPATRQLRARFALPEGAATVTLVAPTSTPADLSESPDPRALGLSLASLAIDDGFEGPREIALADPRLDEGFYPHEGSHRWTRGRARLPADLWAGMEGPLALCLTLSRPPLPRWLPPPPAPLAAVA